MTDWRVGHGYDVHRLVSGRRLILGGIEIEYERGLDGHSDADVLTHAVMDAFLGAAGLGDIGRHFPPSDPQYKDADSIDLLKLTWAKLKNAGYTSVVNLDCIVMAEQPKLGGHFSRMQARLAEALEIEDAGRINLKATTTEGLGFVGRGEGIAASAVCLIQGDG